MDILRFITAGNVDDGKSTLTGRLLHDTHSIKADVLQSVSGDEGANLAHITDGLRAERQQGITIDVAYKYMTTAERKYIITDAPGHFQYTCNLVTGASGVDLMIVLVDALNGITAQTRRHTLVASFLGLQHVVVAINKMDTIEYNERRFNTICSEYSNIAKRLLNGTVTYIPISALEGDNVLQPSANMPWYSGPTLMQYLEQCTPVVTATPDFRMHVQYVSPDGSLAGKISGGSISIGDKVTTYPGNKTTVVSRIVTGYTETDNATTEQHIVLYLRAQDGIGRGSLLSAHGKSPLQGNNITAHLCWLSDAEELKHGKDYILRIGTMEISCRVSHTLNKTDVDTCEPVPGDHTIQVNDFTRVTIATDKPIACDTFLQNRETGRGILIDPDTGNTCAAITIETITTR